MLATVKYSVLLAFVFNALILGSAQSGSGRKCTIDPREDLNNTQVLYLHPNVTQFLYPVTEDSLLLDGDGPVLRIACAAGTIAVRKNITTWSSVLVECVGGRVVKVSGTWIYTPLSDIGCASTEGPAVAEPSSQLTERKAPNGKALAEVGYQLGALEFVPVIDEISVSKRSAGYIARWAHYKVAGALGKQVQSQETEVKLSNGPLSGVLAYDEVYDRAQQRKQFLLAFGDEETVEKYLPVKGTDVFVAGQLVAANDLYYPVERNATYFYETTTPVWASVNSGNWRLVGDAVRQLAQQSLAELEVWSGSYLTLYLPNAAGKNVYVTLGHNIKPAQFLFKYVYDRTNHRGIVYITVNNPHLTEATKNNIICEPVPSCHKEYPEFAKFDRGYTYCCSLKDFEQHAVKLGLPLFDDLITMRV